MRAGRSGRVGLAIVVALLVTTGLPPSPAAAAPPANDTRAGATTVAALPASVSVDTTEATLDAEESALEAACGLAATPAVWLAYRTKPGYQQRLRALVVAFKGALAPIIGVRADGSTAPVACQGAPPPPLDADTTYYLLILRNDFGSFGVDISDVTCFPLPGAAPASGGLPPCPSLVVGAPGAPVGGRGAAGTVDQHFWRSHERLFGATSPLVPGPSAGGSAAAGAGFGSVITTGLVDADDLLDVVVGVPAATVAGRRRAGAVHVVFGSTDGLGRGRPSLLLTRPPGRARAGDRFGAAVAVDGQRYLHEVPPDPRVGRLHALAVGVPGADVAGRRDAGAVTVYRFTGTSGQPTAEQLRQGGGLAGPPGSGNQVGAAVAWLASGSFDASVPDDTLVVGVPGAEVSGHRAAGSVVTWTTSTRRTRAFGQDAPGMPDRAERGDRFGAALATGSGEFSVAVGAPGEDVAGVRDAGAVGLLGCRTELSLATPGVAGRGRRGDAFGSVLAVQLDATFNGGQRLVVGVPRRDVRHRRDAGAVVVVSLPASCGRVTGRLLSQASRGVPGRPETGDRFGAAVATTPRYQDTNLPFEGFFGSDLVVVGAPGEDVRGRRDAGVVQLLLPTGPVLFGPAGRPRAHARYGAAVG